MVKSTAKVKLQWESVKTNGLVVHKACLNLAKFWESPIRYFLIPLNSGEWTAVRSTYCVESEELDRDGIGFFNNLEQAKNACELDMNNYMRGN